MICVRCNLAKVEIESPDKWCNNCWNDWWFDLDFHTENLSEDQRRTITTRIIVSRVIAEYEQEFGKITEEILDELIADPDMLFNRAKELGPNISNQEIINEIIEQIHECDDGNSLLISSRYKS